MEGRKEGRKGKRGRGKGGRVEEREKERGRRGAEGRRRQGGRAEILSGSTEEEIFRKIKCEPGPSVLAENFTSFLVRWDSWVSFVTDRI